MKLEMMPFLEPIRKEPSRFILESMQLNTSKSMNTNSNVNIDKLRELASRRRDLLSSMVALGLDEVHLHMDIPISTLKHRLKYESQLENENPLHKSEIVPGPVMRKNVPSRGNNRNSANITKAWAMRLEELAAQQKDGAHMLKLDTASGESKSTDISGNLQPSARASQVGPVLKAMRIKRKWPEWLGTVTYEVTKCTDMGKQLPRLIKLTEYHILNIKPNCRDISKSTPYTAIQRIWLEGTTNVMLYYRSGKQNMYISPIAPHIVQQITTRVQIRNALEKSTIEGKSKLKNKRVGSISSTPNGPLESEMSLDSEFTNDYTQTMQVLIHNIMQGGREADDKEIAFLSGKGMGTGLGMGSGIVRDDANLINYETDRIVPTDTTKKESENADEPDCETGELEMDWTPRLLSYNENTAEYKVQQMVQKLVFNADNPVGNTRRHFIEKFDIDDKSVSDIRDFIDGLYEYILEHHGVELAILLISEGEDSKSDGTSHGNGGRRDGRDTRTRLMELEDPSLLHTVLEKHLFNKLSYIIFSVAEESVFLPLEHLIKELIPSAWLKEEEKYFLLKLKVFSHCPQSRWSITDASPLNWQAAVFELAGIERNPTPSMRLNALVRTAKAIYTEFNLVVKPKLMKENALKAEAKAKARAEARAEAKAEAEARSAAVMQSQEHERSSTNTARFSLSFLRPSLRSNSSSNVYSANTTHGNALMEAAASENNTTSVISNEPIQEASAPSEPVLGADDLVPIFIYVLCQCHKELKSPITNKDMLWNICYPDQLHGEAGYYLTLYESAVEFIMQEPFSADEGMLGEAVMSEIRSNSISGDGNRASDGSDSRIRWEYFNRDSQSQTDGSDTGVLRTARNSIASALTYGSANTASNLDKSKARFESGSMRQSFGEETI